MNEFPKRIHFDEKTDEKEEIQFFLSIEKDVIFIGIYLFNWKYEAKISGEP